ncbi:abasic site processing protein HMCES-like isoform X1 [Schistocerca piceifrons]|uniref:abasic site processing protein HMCES-like isoform X1 n=2 Tax=Schistocerca piceifrons TaxID=274613 RepID=UPI001F5E52CD|nr:abasic site processing protein HMCES-like isoform X1 [Schistocerca piceifrons]XP_049959046.1 abasic site processing protein HMCES-like isoform X1 [Schistocerca serialis cubense]
MCGRTACTLDPECICKATTYRRKDSNTYCLPEWKHMDDKYHVYRPSTNIAPTEVLPAIISGHQLGKTSDRIIVPMIWGMIPPWHKGDYRTHGLTTHNIRDDNLFLSKLYLPVFKQSNRCVVLCDGFYEWKKEEGGRGKQPYFIYMPQSLGIDIYDRKTWNLEWTAEGGWKGPRLLALAGLYNIWVSPEGDKVYSCSVFTTTPNDDFKYIHHRIPVVLENDEAIEMWLDVAGKAPIDAVALLKAPKLLAYHPVSNIVNNSRNKDDECMKPIDPNRPKLGASAALMESWLKQKYGSLKRPEENAMVTEVNEDAKRVKVAEQQQQQQEQRRPQLQVQQQQDVDMREQEEEEEMEDDEEEDEDDDIEEDEDEVAEEEEDEDEEAVDDEENDDDDDDEDDDEVMDDEEDDDDDDDEEDDEIEEEEEENSVKMEPESDVAASSGDEERADVAGSGTLTTSAELCTVTSVLETEDLPSPSDMCTDESDVLDTQ